MKEDIDILKERMVLNAKKLFDTKALLVEERSNTRKRLIETFKTSIQGLDRLIEAKKKEGLDQKTLDFAIQQILISLENSGVSMIDPSNSIEGFFVIVGTEKNPNKKEGDLAKISKNGFTYDGEVLRPMEKILVKNS